MTSRNALLASAAIAALLVTTSACGSSAAEPATEAATDAAPSTSAGAATGLRQVTPGEAADLIGASDDVVVLDIRTPEEFAAGHVDGALMVDFYQPDFAERIAALDRDTSYVVYCNSGNRSGAAMQLFADLGFASVTEVAGGVVAWAADGLPLVR